MLEAIGHATLLAEASVVIQPSGSNPVVVQRFGEGGADLHSLLVRGLSSGAVAGFDAAVPEMPMPVSAFQEHFSGGRSAHGTRHTAL